MSDTHDQPETPEPAGQVPSEASATPTGSAPEPQYRTEASRDEVVVRRSPRYGAFIAAGAVVGAIVALVLSISFAPSEAELAERMADDFTYSQSQVFGFLLVCGVVIGVGLGALVALIVDRAMSRRATRALAEHDETHRVGG
ncbi:hypothetical protein [Agromyces italicus]|uniref:hypothetical protein n=1 Tax=Agromyces italicus TaxID=279572 RepID=UPI0003B73DED|nr:hypothetical protein [Agromyces italicus]